MRPEFTAHNIELPDGTQTRPGAPLIGAEPATESYLRTLRLFCPPPARVADLGCLEGGYAVTFARAGYDVLGIEGQRDNFEVCQWVSDRVQLVAFLRTLHNVTRRLLILNTNFATEGGHERDVYSLSEELSEHEGALGRWYEEGVGAWSSIVNRRSFWLERRHLLRAMIQAGFPTVFEQFDWLSDPVADRTIEDRVIACFVGVK